MATCWNLFLYLRFYVCPSCIITFLFQFHVDLFLRWGPLMCFIKSFVSHSGYPSAPPRRPPIQQVCTRICWFHKSLVLFLTVPILDILDSVAFQQINSLTCTNSCLIEILGHTRASFRTVSVMVILKPPHSGRFCQLL